MNMNLQVFSAEEDLWLWRIRQESRLGQAQGRSMMTQEEAAEILDLSIGQYANLENGRTANLTIAQTNSILTYLHANNSIKITLYEQLLLARRRSGIYVGEVAKALHLSTGRFYIIEKECDARIIAYWQSQGFHGFLSEPQKGEKFNEASFA